MKNLTWWLLFGTTGLAQSITDVPQCAQTCLSTSTTSQTTCQITDLKCLCTNSQYVNALSCCLATQCNTSEQQQAIAFNQQECASVNQTAPGFVGCSPIALSSLVVVGGSATASGTVTAKIASSTSKSISISTSVTSYNPQVSTITLAPISALGSFSLSNTVTATYNAALSLLTGSCTVPHFAMVTNSFGSITEYPEVGCSPERPDCCPFPYTELAVITKCPADYFTTAGSCCPTGYQIYFAKIGAETPCYTMPPITYVPGSTPTATGVTLITEHVFSKMYQLVVPQAGGSNLPLGGLIGIIVNVILFIAVITAVIWCVRRRRKRLEPPLVPVNREMSEPELGEPRPVELASPQSQHSSPGPATNDWPGPASSPPAYEDSRSQPASTKQSVPQELPGSTYIYEHHPAFNAASPGMGAMEQSTSAVTLPSSPSINAATPPRSPPGHVSPRSTVTSPRSPAARTEGSPAISPYNSPSQN